ncbi:hypothetical protein [Candidatus Nephthysia bennettiae]|uniref:hypothetical protein n=1 Tax=Candidatus Nephthysia bennettiae TaxID=3127016 RepID=UPI0030C6C27B
MWLRSSWPRDGGQGRKAGAEGMPVGWDASPTGPLNLPMVGSAALLTAAGLSLPRRQLFEDAEAPDGEVPHLQPLNLEPAEPGRPDRKPANGEGSDRDRADGKGPDGDPDGRHRQRAPRQD